MDGKQIVADLKARLGVNTDEDLARKIGVTMSTIRGWKYLGRKPGRLTQMMIEIVEKEHLRERGHSRGKTQR